MFNNVEFIYMKEIDPQTIIEKLKSTLTKNSVDFEKIIKELGQEEAANKRLNGHQFTLDDHVKGMIHAMLSNNRPWEPIANNMDNLNEIFLNYDVTKLEKADPQELENQVKSIQCGNRAINPQMKYLKHNINQFKQIQKDYNSIDNFIEETRFEDVVKLLSDPKSPYKIKQMGPPLTMEYLKNVGIIGIKPDVHLLRICGPERLGIFENQNLNEVIKSFEELSKETNLSMTYLDNLFWIFGAKDYGEICSATPKCYECDCELRNYCNYPKNHPL
jgi:uncharacterized protein YdcH (DUF465 family)